MQNVMTTLLHTLPPELAHDVALWGLKKGLGPTYTPEPDQSMAVKIGGLTLSHPFGLAAGFDKNAAALDGLARLGFSHIEAGTVTPHPQGGNPKPRLFRLTKDGAVINRMGFNNAGLDAFCSNLSQPRSHIVGANIGCNKDSPDRTADFITGLSRVYALADYVTVNVSSPNTPGLRDMQAEVHMTALMERLHITRMRLHDEGHTHKPLFIKLAPDLADDGAKAVADAALRFGIDGLIVSNTTLSRPASLQSSAAHQAGGLSGTPLFELATQQLRMLYKHTGGQLIFVGAGGVRTGTDAYAKLKAGATLVQGYTGMIYHGPSYASHVVHGLKACMEADNINHIADVIGTDA